MAKKILAVFCSICCAMVIFAGCSTESSVESSTESANPSIAETMTEEVTNL